MASFSQEKETEQSSPKELLGPWPKTFEDWRLILPDVSSNSLDFFRGCGQASSRQEAGRIIKNVDRDGRRLHEIELRQQAGDNVLFVINPGPHQKISHSSIWDVTEEELHEAGKALDYHRVGDCEIYFYAT